METLAHLRTRPEDLVVGRGDLPPGLSLLGEAVVKDHVFSGRHLDAIVDFDGTRLRAHVPLERSDDGYPFRPGSKVRLALDPQRALGFSPDGETLYAAGGALVGQTAGA